MTVETCRPSSDDLLELIKLIPGGRLPKRADRSAAGYMPGRAMRYCDAMTSAAGYGYWVFPVMDMQLIWDGEQIFWSYEEADDWLPLSGTASSAAQYPDFSGYFDEHAPVELRGFSPPFLTALPEPGTIQIWTGLVGRTRPGWSLLLREPVNLGPTVGLSGWEGVIETDQWFGPLFGIFRLTKTDFTVRLRAHVPFIQLQPVPQAAYRETNLNAFSVKTMSEMSELDWSQLGDVLNPDLVKREKAGDYAVQVRKRRSCPVHTRIADEAAGDGKP